MAGESTLKVTAASSRKTHLTALPAGTLEGGLWEPPNVQLVCPLSPRRQPAALGEERGARSRQLPQLGHLGVIFFKITFLLIIK